MVLFVKSIRKLFVELEKPTGTSFIINVSNQERTLSKTFLKRNVRYHERTLSRMYPIKNRPYKERTLSKTYPIKTYPIKNGPYQERTAWSGGNRRVPMYLGNQRVYTKLRVSAERVPPGTAE